MTFKDANISPLYGCVKGSWFADKLIKEIGTKKKLGKPWKYVGNNFMKMMVLKYRPNIRIFPSYYFVPEYKNGDRYGGDFIPYAEHRWGTTRECYHLGE